MNPDPLPGEDDLGRLVDDVVDEVLDEDPALGGPVIGESVDRVLDEAGAPPRVRVAASEASELAAPDQTPGWAETLVRFLDDGVKVPGTDFGVGADALIGLIPGVGDAITGTGSLSLIYLGFKERIPTVALARMVLNIAIDTLGGTLPVVGDVFDVFWKSNRKNLDLIEKFRSDPDAKPSAVDYLLVFVALVLVVVSVLMPVFVFWLLVSMGILAADQALGS